jgi:formylglycine-generating enzyme required for sulfatase activity
MQTSTKFTAHSGRFVVVVLVVLIGLITSAAGVYLWVHRVFAVPGMVYYPGGAFPFGPDNKPMNLGPFYMDAMEVSNADFAEFCRSAGCTPPAGAPNLPVVNVTVAQARAFAQWKGRRLPTPAEWERASRGVDSLRYPWGREEDPKRANVLDNPILTQHALIPVKSFAATPEYQMVGNVWEMLEGPVIPTAEDLARFAQLTPPATADEKWIQIRGGSFNTPLADAVTYQYRAIPERYAALDIGFRCAKPLKP